MQQPIREIFTTLANPPDSPGADAWSVMNSDDFSRDLVLAMFDKSENQM
jgi:hypothetical protein